MNFDFLNNKKKINNTKCVGGGGEGVLACVCVSGRGEGGGAGLCGGGWGGVTVPLAATFTSLY